MQFCAVQTARSPKQAEHFTEKPFPTIHVFWQSGPASVFKPQPVAHSVDRAKCPADPPASHNDLSAVLQVEGVAASLGPMPWQLSNAVPQLRLVQAWQAAASPPGIHFAKQFCAAQTAWLPKQAAHVPEKPFPTMHLL
jgi:hypothetical protein